MTDTLEKKLVLGSDTFLPRYCGVGRFVEQIIPVLKEEFDVTALVPDFGDESVPVRKIKFPVRRFGINDYHMPIRNSRMKKTIENHVREADVVFVQSIGPIGEETLRAARKFGKPSAYFMHCVDSVMISESLPLPNFLKKIVREGISVLAKPVYELADTFIVAGEESKKYLESIHAKVPTASIHLGINTCTFAPSDKDIAKKAIGIDPRDFVIGYVGRISRDKGIPTLTDAFASFNAKYPHSRLLMVGKAIKDYENNLKQAGIIATGPQSNVAPYYAAMDAFVLPSHHEVACLVAKEAMACEIPLISTPIGDIRDYLVNGKNGILLRPNDTKQLVNELEILYHDEGLRKKIGTEARKTVCAEYDWATNSGKILNIIKNLC